MKGIVTCVRTTIKINVIDGSYTKGISQDIWDHCTFFFILFTKGGCSVLLDFTHSIKADRKFKAMKLLNKFPTPGIPVYYQSKIDRKGGFSCQCVLIGSLGSLGALLFDIEKYELSIRAICDSIFC